MPKNRRPFRRLVAHPAVEGFDTAILHRLSGSDVMPLDAVTLRGLIPHEYIWTQETRRLFRVR
jgi:hypothetical protein